MPRTVHIAALTCLLAAACTRSGRLVDPTPEAAMSRPGLFGMVGALQDRVADWADVAADCATSALIGSDDACFRTPARQPRVSPSSFDCDR